MNKFIIFIFTVLFLNSASAENFNNEVFEHGSFEKGNYKCVGMKYTTGQFIGFVECWPTDHDSNVWVSNKKGFKTYMNKGKFCVKTTNKKISFVSNWEDNSFSRVSKTKFKLVVKTPKNFCV